jgi:hypothetical protein
MMFSIFRKWLESRIMGATENRGVETMPSSDQKRHVLGRLLSERRPHLPRPARLFVEGLLQDEPLLERMRFCRWEERGQLRNSILISTEDGTCWAVLLGNDPENSRTSSMARARLALEGLDLSPAEVLDRLRQVPIWFLALDDEYSTGVGGEAAAADRTAHRLAALPFEDLRRAVLWDQMDAALEAGDLTACRRLRELLAASA